jgi:hypothetical protein
VSSNFASLIILKDIAYKIDLESFLSSYPGASSLSFNFIKAFSMEAGKVRDCESCYSFA